jgi:hypothetical protein
MYTALTLLLFNSVSWWYVYAWILSNQVIIVFTFKYLHSEDVFYLGGNHLVESLVVPKPFQKLS